MVHLPRACNESFLRLSRTDGIDSDACFVTDRNRSLVSGYETPVTLHPPIISRYAEDLSSAEGTISISLSKRAETMKEASRVPRERERGPKARRCVCNGNSYGLDSLIKFSIHIHSFARRKSIQVASSLCYQLLVSFEQRTVGGEKRV